jgi:4-alpha-glucanotransferase
VTERTSLAEDEEITAAVLVGILEDLGRSDAELVVLSLEDLWFERRPQNVPGVGPDGYPSWRRRAARTIADIAGDADISAVLTRLQSAREVTEESRC